MSFLVVVEKSVGRFLVYLVESSTKAKPIFFFQKDAYANLVFRGSHLPPLKARGACSLSKLRSLLSVTVAGFWGKVHGTKTATGDPGRLKLFSVSLNPQKCKRQGLDCWFGSPLAELFSVP